MKCRKYVVLFTLFAMNLVDQPAPEVRISQGILSGKISTDGTFYEYVGIPYATANTFNRFQAPLPPPQWSGVYKAVEEYYQCPQSTLVGIIGEEDCLKINVYVPVEYKQPLPVMVYIHGGAFVFGSGGKLMYGPDFIVKQNVILVTFNYRLNIFGFLCLGIKEAPGNAGLKDQLAALRWVKKNIAAFGGDPENVTLFGESAGATSVSLLLLSNVTNDLFYKAIVQSGSGLSHWAINQNPLEIARTVVKELGYDIKNPEEMYNILSKLPYKELMTYLEKYPTTRLLLDDLMLLPCVEEEIPGVERIIADLPYNLITRTTKDMPIIYGSTDREGLYIISSEDEKTLEEWNQRSLITTDLKFKYKQEEKQTEKKVREFYFKNERITMKTLMKLSNLLGDLYFEMPAILEAEIYLRKNNDPIYQYSFQYDGGRNMVKFNSGYWFERGACHADDIAYLFNAHIWPFPMWKNDLKVIDWMTRMWTNFAKYGNPTPDRENFPVKWIPSTKNNLNFLYINEELTLGSLPKPKNFALWKNIYERYRSLNVLK